jgi:hypothetical protein
MHDEEGKQRLYYLFPNSHPVSDLVDNFQCRIQVVSTNVGVFLFIFCEAGSVSCTFLTCWLQHAVLSMHVPKCRHRKESPSRFLQYSQSVKRGTDIFGMSGRDIVMVNS